ncbi:hypothetical protein ACIBL6_35205 [Streptomyces sp. NPDC050400]|uniref:hypothetical protein n=1 Tax=Streptomyces sp. NPDC050400 TaxID=3365610 RepID=UPI0037AA9D62
MGYGIPSRQTVNAAGGRLRAVDVAAGTQLWSLDGERTTPTTVIRRNLAKAREAVDVVTEHATFRASPELLLWTPDGWVHAADAEGTVLAWTHARKLCRVRLSVRPCYAFGYFVGATCADGTVGKNYVSLVVNDEGFARRYAASVTEATGLPARPEPVVRPSGFLGRDVPGFRVRVVSSYLADLLRQFLGGDPHHMRQQFPRVVLHSRDVFAGFLDGYVDGDGCVYKSRSARTVVSANIPFLAELATVVGAKFTPDTKRSASQLFIVDHWERRGTFQPEPHSLELKESAWVQVHEVRRHVAGDKPFTFYSWLLGPHPGFLVNGHLARQPW